MLSDLFKIASKETITRKILRPRRAWMKQFKDSRDRSRASLMRIYRHNSTKKSKTLRRRFQVFHLCENSEAKQRSIRSFHWELEFPEIFFDLHGNPKAQKGFDCCIGNPPYVFARETLSKSEKGYFSKRFEETALDKPNLYIMFIQLAVELTREPARIGMILPNAWLGVDSAEKLRGLLLERARPVLCVICLYLSSKE